jgi:hypothetical protein
MSHMLPADYVVKAENNYRRQDLIREAQMESLARQATKGNNPLAIGNLVGHVLNIIASAYTHKQETEQPTSLDNKVITQELPITSH